MHQYRIYIDDLIQGPFKVDELLAVKGFTESCLVCQVGESEWIPAGQVGAIRKVIAPASTVVEPIMSATKPSSLSRFYVKPPHRIHHSGDYISPNFQFDKPGKKFRDLSMKSKEFRVIDLPQPRQPSNVRWIAILVFVAIGSSFWTFKTTSSVPASFQTGWHALHKKLLTINFDPVLRPFIPKYSHAWKK